MAVLALASPLCLPVAVERGCFVPWGAKFRFGYKLRISEILFRRTSLSVGRRSPRHFGADIRLDEESWKFDLVFCNVTGYFMAGESEVSFLKIGVGDMGM
jgi:hypothetical protein